MQTRNRNTSSVENARPKYLKVYREDERSGASIDPQTLPGWRNVTRSFLDLTGWLMRFVPGEGEGRGDVPVRAADTGRTLGHLRLDPVDPKSHEQDDIQRLQALAEAAAEMLGELLVTHEALSEREAELATAIPVTPHPEESRRLAARLEAVLRSGAVAVGCQAAGLYVLDDGTTELKLRAAWGLPRTKLAEPPRVLKGALADLEAMLGHAVVLETAALVEQWRSPEPYASAVCLPVATPTNILGTMWVYSDIERSFDEHDTGILEVVSGRLAAELEREVALQTAVQSERLRREFQSATRFQRGQLPTIAPLLDGWDFAGWTNQVEGLGGDFHDWFCLPQGKVAIAVGDVETRRMEAALTQTALRTAIRSHAHYVQHTGKLLERVNLTLWTGSAGDQVASAFVGMLDPQSGKLHCSTAGTAFAAVVRAERLRRTASVGPSLGSSPESRYSQYRLTIEPGEILVVCTQGLRKQRDAAGKLLWDATVLPMIRALGDKPAKHILRQVVEHLDNTGVPADDDRTLLLIRRTEASADD
ncbi:hypothetical protein JCM19992_03430 [Thermostilla marina]